MKHLSKFIILSLLFSANAFSLTGEQLYSVCKLTDKWNKEGQEESDIRTKMAVRTCLMYITGFDAGSTSTSQYLCSKNKCLPEENPYVLYCSNIYGAKTKDFISTYVNWAELNNNQLSQSAHLTLSFALINKYPCQKKP